MEGVSISEITRSDLPEAIRWGCNVMSINGNSAENRTKSEIEDYCNDSKNRPLSMSFSPQKGKREVKLLHFGFDKDNETVKTVRYTWPNPGPLGLKVKARGHKGESKGVQLSKVREVERQAMGLEPGLVLTLVNGVRIDNKPFEEVMKVIAHSGRPCTILFQPCPHLNKIEHITADLMEEAVTVFKELAGENMHLEKHELINMGSEDLLAPALFDNDVETISLEGFIGTIERLHHDQPILIISLYGRYD